jgi:hypothetical protein
MGCWRELGPCLVWAEAPSRGAVLVGPDGRGGGSLLRTPSPNGPILFWNRSGGDGPGLEIHRSMSMSMSMSMSLLRSTPMLHSHQRKSKAELTQRAVIPSCNIEPQSPDQTQSRERSLDFRQCEFIKFRLAPAITSVANVG